MYASGATNGAVYTRFRIVASAKKWLCRWYSSPAIPTITDIHPATNPRARESRRTNMPGTSNSGAASEK